MNHTGKLIVEDFDTAEMFSTPADRAALINDALESGDARYLSHAIGLAARAHGMSKIAGATASSRGTLYKALSREGNPTIATLLPVLTELGLTLRAEQIKA